MYRSVTFSEIFSSTFSDDLNRYDDSYDNNVKSRFVAKIGIGLIEFLLSSIFLCYGIIFSESVNTQYYTAEDGLWTTILYISSWNLAATFCASKYLVQVALRRFCFVRTSSTSFFIFPLYWIFHQFKNARCSIFNDVSHFYIGPWSRLICSYFENNRYNIRYVIGATVVLLFFGLIVPNQILAFGVFGGVFSNLIHTQLKQTATEKFCMDSKVFEGNVQVARALTLLIMPHFTLLLVSYYSISQLQLIIAAFLLNVFPAALIIKPEDEESQYTAISRYQTLPAFSSQVREMMNFTNSITLSDSHKSETTSIEDEKEEETDILSTSEDLSFDNAYVSESTLQPAYLTPLTVETYYKNAGVSILPQIPEEGEIETGENEYKMRNSVDLTKVTVKLKEIIQQPIITRQVNDNINIKDIITTNKTVEYETDRENEKDILNIKALVSNRYLDSCEKIQNIEYIPEFTEKENRTKYFREMKSMKMEFCCCTPYRQFIWRRRFRTVRDFFLDNIFIPFSVSFKDLHFYPTVMSKITTSITSTMYITLAPYVASQKNTDFQPEDATFLLSYIAFSWCLFLVLIPLIINFSHAKVRVTFICGLLLTGTSMTLISRKMTNDVITISCLMFGFGYGATNFTENMVYKSFIGSRKWSTVKGTLETISALFVILTYYIIYTLKLDIRILLFVAFITFYLNAILWIIAPIFKEMVIIINKKCCKKRTQKNVFLDDQYY